MVQSKDRSKVRPLAVFLVDQAARTLRQPSRLLFVPFLLPSYFPRLLTLVLAILPVRWPQGVRGKAFRLAIGNLVLLRHDRPEQAWHWMERVLSAGSRSTEEYFLGAVCLYQGLGRMREATALFARANDRDFARAETFGVAHAPYRVLDEVWARHIGDVATLDYVIKLGALEGRRPEDTILYLQPGRRIGNRFPGFARSDVPKIRWSCSRSASFCMSAAEISPAFGSGLFTVALPQS